MPLDLHVLGPPLAFILSQDQTLHCKKLYGNLHYVEYQMFVLYALLVSEVRHYCDRPPGFQ